MSHLKLVSDDLEMSDAAIVARVSSGEIEAFETLMRRHNRRLFRALRAVLKSDDEAEDAMQEAYVSAFAHLKEFGGRSNFSTWLVRIGVYEALRRLRRGKRFSSLEDLEMVEEPVANTRTPEEALNDTELASLLESSVDALPVAFRAVFVLRMVEGMSVTETAEALDIPEETVRTRLHRARHILQQRLFEQTERVAPQAFEFHLSRCDRTVAAVLLRIAPPRPH